MIIPVDQSQACSSVSLFDDAIAEGTQIFFVYIDSVYPTGDIDQDGEHMAIKILDNDGKNVLCDT